MNRQNEEAQAGGGGEWHYKTRNVVTASSSTRSGFSITYPHYCCPQLRHDSFLVDSYSFELHLVDSGKGVASLAGFVGGTQL